MRYICQKVPSRDVSELLAQLPDLVICEDHKRDPLSGLLTSLCAAGSFAHVHLEDDTHLTSNFRAKIEHAISMYPDRVINFFNVKKKMYGISEMPAATFLMLQCVYFPAGMAEDIVKYCKTVWLHENAHQLHQIDVMIRHYLKHTKTDYIIWHPPLVQHKQVKSVIDPRRSSKRQNPHFKE